MVKTRAVTEIILKSGTSGYVTINGQNYSRANLKTVFAEDADENNIMSLHYINDVKYIFKDARETNFYNGDDGNSPSPFASWAAIVEWVGLHLEASTGIDSNVAADMRTDLDSISASVNVDGALYGQTQSVATSAAASDLKLADILTNTTTVANNQAGANNYMLVSLASTNKNLISAGALKIVAAKIINTNAAKLYVKLYDSATAEAVTVGTTVPVLTIEVAAKSATSGTQNCDIVNGFNFSYGIVIATTTGVADSDVAAVGAGDLYINVMYKTV